MAQWELSATLIAHIRVKAEGREGGRVMQRQIKDKRSSVAMAQSELHATLKADIGVRADGRA